VASKSYETRRQEEEHLNLVDLSRENNRVEAKKRSCDGLFLV